MKEWPVYPRMEFGTIGQFFKEAESVRDKLPVVQKELNFVFAGCYTTQSRIKRGNRINEALLYESEACAALAAADGYHHDAARYAEKWSNVLFTHFHDILTGSTVQDSREYAMGLYADTQAYAGSQRSIALRKLTERIDTTPFARFFEGDDRVSDGAGVGYGAAQGFHTAADCGTGITRLFHLFNPLPYAREETAELRVWDWTGDNRDITALDANGEAVPCQVLDNEAVSYWGHYYTRVLIQAKVPAMGYATYAITEGTPDPRRYYYATARLDEPAYEDIVLENEAVRAVFSCKSGELISLRDKNAGAERIKPDAPGGFRLVECQRAGSSAWKIGRYVKEERLDKNVVISDIVAGGLRQGFTLKVKFLSSSLTARVSLDSGTSGLRLDTEVTWNEYSSEGGSVPLLRYALPLIDEPDAYRFDIAAGVIDRRPANIDMPAHTFGAAVYRDGALRLSSDCKYGYRVADGVLGLTLIHAPDNPDPFPERGIHKISLCVNAGSGTPGALKRSASRFIHPLLVMPARLHTGDKPAEASLLALDDGDVVLEAVKPAENGRGTVIRLLNLGTENAVTKLTLPNGAASAAYATILEEPLPGNLTVTDGKLTVEIPAGQLITILI
jgi:alpha-mannosidase